MEEGKLLLQSYNTLKMDYIHQCIASHRKMASFKK
jgi:hypothetical protein